MSSKLIDDCFQHGSQRLSHEEAIAALSARISPVAGVEAVAASAALGRILARPVTAGAPVPNHTNAAVDGFAFAQADLAASGEGGLITCGRSAAGHPFTGKVGPGSAVRIFTGAAMPSGVDTVAMQEDCAVSEMNGVRRVVIPAGLMRGANVRRAGEDVAAGAELFQAGHLLRPQDLAALASIGQVEVACRARLRVAVVSTGDEVIRPDGQPLAPGRVFDANAPMLAALATLAGCEVVDLGIWPDQEDAVRAGLAKAASAFDVILTSGGASGGEEDYMATALAGLGSRHFWQIQVRPGRPMMFGQIGDTVVVGLPGNPVAVFVCMLMYVWPMLRRLSGAAWPEPRRLVLPAGFAFPDRKPGRREFWRGSLRQTPTGLVVDKFARDGSGLISGLRAADGLIDIPAATVDIMVGDEVSYIPLGEYGIVR